MKCFCPTIILRFVFHYFYKVLKSINETLSSISVINGSARHMGCGRNNVCKFKQHPVAKQKFRDNFGCTLYQYWIKFSCYIKILKGKCKTGFSCIITRKYFLCRRIHRCIREKHHRTDITFVIQLESDQPKRLSVYVIKVG